MKILIREARIRRGFTLEKLSMLSGISVKQLSRIENNLVDLRLSTLCSIAKALAIPPCDLFDPNESIWR